MSDYIGRDYPLTGPWTTDRTEPQRDNVPHHPFTLQLSLPTKLDPAYVRTVKTRSSGDPSEIVERVRRSVRAADFVVVSDSKLLMGHGSGERSYPKGTDIFLLERNVRVDVPENARGGRKPVSTSGPWGFPLQRLHCSP